jgi:hypothetical protein
MLGVSRSCLKWLAVFAAVVTFGTTWAFCFAVRTRYLGVISVEVYYTGSKAFHFICVGNLMRYVWIGVLWSRRSLHFMTSGGKGHVPSRKCTVSLHIAAYIKRTVMVMIKDTIRTMSEMAQAA